MANDRAGLKAKLARHMPATVSGVDENGVRKWADIPLDPDTIVLEVIVLENGGRHVHTVPLDTFINVALGLAPGAPNIPATAGTMRAAIAAAGAGAAAYGRFVDQWAAEGLI